MTFRLTITSFPREFFFNHFEWIRRTDVVLATCDYSIGFPIEQKPCESKNCHSYNSIQARKIQIRCMKCIACILARCKWIWNHNWPTFRTASISKTYFSVTRQWLHMVSKFLQMKMYKIFVGKLYFSIVIFLFRSLAIRFRSLDKTLNALSHTCSLSHLSGGVLLAMMINLALPCLNDFNVWL